MKSPKIKYHFSIKDENELKDLSYEELMEYTKNLTKDWHKLKKPKKDSSNSSIAPSSDIAKKKKNQSLRDKSSKLNGGQVGHKGTTLKQTNTPNEIIDIDYNIKVCKKCNYNLSDVITKLKEKRQVLDLDLKNIKSKITQYQSYYKTCTNCGYNNHDNAYPNLVTPNISYGKTIIAVVNYLSIVQYLPYNRIVSLLQNLFNISISQGTVNNLLKKASKLSQNELNKIVNELELSDLVGIDETSCKINGDKHWYWTFQNDTGTFIVMDKSRGSKIIKQHFKNGFKNATVVHDNYSGYSNLDCKNEQLCLAHKLRDLNYAIECDNTQVIKDIKQLLEEAMIIDKKDLEPFQRIVLKIQYILTLDKLLETKSIPKSETAKQIKSFKKSSHKIFTFLDNQYIPPDNNGSERAIRNIKVKSKVSQQFKSTQGAIDYANIRSIVDTSRKRGLNEFESLQTIINGVCLF